MSKDLMSNVVLAATKVINLCRNASEDGNSTHRLLMQKQFHEKNSQYAVNFLGTFAFFLNLIAVWTIACLLKLKYLDWNKYCLILHIAVVDTIVSVCILVVENLPPEFFGENWHEMKIVILFLEMMAWPLFVLVPSMSYLALTAFEFVSVRRPNVKTGNPAIQVRISRLSWEYLFLFLVFYSVVSIGPLPFWCVVNSSRHHTESIPRELSVVKKIKISIFKIINRF